MHTQQQKDDFLGVVLANKGIILKICNAFTKNKTDREDLAQEIIYHLWKGAESFDPQLKFTTWMYRVALNVAIAFYRKEKKLQKIIDPDAMLMEIADEVYDQPLAEGASLLQQHIKALKELDRALILLYFEEKSYKEIGGIMGLTETNVATKLNRLKEKLKQAIVHQKKI